MTLQIESIEDFAKKNKIYRGEWEIYYNDNNYLPVGKFIPICKIIFDDLLNISDTIENDYDLIINAFTLKIYAKNQIMESLKKIYPSNEKFDVETKSFIPDLFQELSKSLTRLGIFIPEIDEPILNNLISEQILVFVHDTNAIVNGTTNYILYEFENLKLWNIIPTFIQLEIQEKAAASVKKKETELKNCKYVKDRAFSTNALRVINQIKKKYPLEYIGDPSDLSITKRATEDKRNVLYDRLIIETIKKVYGSRNINGKVVLITSDFDMARFAKMENLDVFHSIIRQINENGDSCYSARFSLIKNEFHLCSIYDLLWDFTNVFGRIKLENKQDKRTCIFNYYMPSKKLLNWQNDQLEIESIDSELDFREKINKFANKQNKSIKMIGLNKILDFIEMLSHQSKEVNINFCMSQLKLSEETCRDYIYVFEGIGIIKQKNGNIASTDLLEIFIKEWEAGNIENIVVILRNYVPFDMFLNMMKKIKQIPKFKIYIDETKKTLVAYGIKDYKAMRVFPNLGIHLGVLYPFEDKIFWANEQPTYETFERSFLSAYNKHKISEGYANMVDIINEVCINLNISIKIFIQLFTNYYQKNMNILRTGGSVMTASNNVIDILDSRSNERRFKTHVLEDGIIISDNVVINSIKIGINNE